MSDYFNLVAGDLAEGARLIVLAAEAWRDEPDGSTTVINEYTEIGETTPNAQALATAVDRYRAAKPI